MSVSIRRAIVRLASSRLLAPATCPDDRPGRARERHDTDGERDVDPPARQRPYQHVPAKVVRPQRVREAGRRERRADQAVRAVGQHGGADQAGQVDHEEQAGADPQGGRPAPHPPHAGEHHQAVRGWHNPLGNDRLGVGRRGAGVTCGQAHRASRILGSMTV